MSSSFLDLYESLDIIGNGSFGIIRKVRRKSDGVIFARKELNFERMNERDRKQIVAEVNILKDLHHDHIVRYHDRHVDRDAGILYILMEYCGGGDLSTVIKQAQKHNRPIPEDTIWNYFLQIALALHHCHHPNTHGRTGSGEVDSDGKERRPQILHRDLKPDNVFLDEANLVKLGDFGLSKALAQASFANTYVGTPYYMSPELMQEKAYDSKSDIWSLGCLIYELCALKPPFHEAKTHSELSIFIRNGRIPPLPRGYSPALSNLIKAMLNLNPAMRPSATQILQSERIELASKVSECEKMLETVKTHKATVIAKERDLLAREKILHENENHITVLLSQKDSQIATLQQLISQFQHQNAANTEMQIRDAITKRDEELRVAIAQREKEVAASIARRETEIMEAVTRREEQMFEAWRTKEEQMQSLIDEKFSWVSRREEELDRAAESLETARLDLEAKVKTLEGELAAKNSYKHKSPLEEVKNLLTPLGRAASRIKSEKYAKIPKIAAIATPIGHNITQFPNCSMPSAMKGVVLTATNEPLATPTPAELVKLFGDSPKVGLNFAKIFEFDGKTGSVSDDGYETDGPSPPPSPSRRERLKADSEGSTSSTSTVSAPSQPSCTAPPTRLRRPSIRASSQRPVLGKVASLPTSISDPTSLSTMSASAATCSASRPVPHTSTSMPVSTDPPPNYDLIDEENLPSPFLKRIDKERPMPAVVGRKSGAATGTIRGKRSSGGGNLVRVVAAANSANGNGRKGSSVSNGESHSGARPSLASARKATEDARKALQRT